MSGNRAALATREGSPLSLNHSTRQQLGDIRERHGFLTLKSFVSNQQGGKKYVRN